MVSMFNELAIVFIIVFILTSLISYFKQPTLIAYILSGVILGPLFFDILSTSGYYELFSHIGVAFLLFIVGLHLNPRLIKEVGVASVITGVGQIVITIAISLLLMFLLGFNFITSIIISIGIAFSSTIVIVKILSDKKALETLSGKISLGFLLVQDFVAVIALIGIESFARFSAGASLQSIAISIIFTAIFGIGLIYGAKYVVNFLFSNSHNSELLLLYSVSWCLGISALFNYLGFSLEIGALIAGIGLASTNMHHEISAKIKPLRDFFLIMFFIVLGSQMFSSSFMEDSLDSSQSMLELIGAEILQILPIVIPLSLLILIGNPIIVFSLLTFLRYTPRVSFNAGLAVSQISEFSLIIGLLALNQGLITNREISILTFIMLITIMISSYMYYHSDSMYKKLKPMLQKLNSSTKNPNTKKHYNYQILLTGLNPNQENHILYMHNTNYSYSVIEAEPKKIKHLQNKGIPTIRGDISNPELLQQFELSHLKAFVSFNNDDETAYLIVETIRKENPQAHIILQASDVEIANELYELGADYIIVPHQIHHDKVFEILKELL